MLNRVVSRHYQIKIKTQRKQDEDSAGEDCVSTTKEKTAITKAEDREQGAGSRDAFLLEDSSLSNCKIYHDKSSVLVYVVIISCTITCR